MILKRPWIALCCAGGLVVTACGSDDGAAADAENSAVVATTSIWADIAAETLCGADVPAIIPAGADSHTFEPSLRDRERLESAQLVISNGGGLEERLVDLLDTVADDGTNLVEITPWVDVLEADGDHHHGDDHDDEAHDDEAHDDETHDDETHDDETHDDETHDDETHDDEGDDHDEHGHDLTVDPHVWQDPLRVVAALDVIASAGAPLGLGDCSDEYGAELTALDADIMEILEPVPAASRIMVTSHDSLRYFADRYGFEIVGSVIPSTNTLAETNAADLADLAEQIEARGVRAIFTEELASTADADALAERLGVRVVPLVTDALTEDDATDTYVEMMRSNAEAIAGALAP